MKYCIATPITLDTTQYRERPLGKVSEKKAIISGIIHSIIIWLDCCLGSGDGIIVIFCWTQVVMKTKAGIIRFVGSGSAKSSQRNPGSSGAAAKATVKGATG